MILIFSFSFNSKYILIYLLISSLTHGLFTSGLFSFQILEYFYRYLCVMISNIILLWLENIVWLESFQIWWGLEYGQSWQIFYVYLRRICILLLLEKVFYKCQSFLFDCAVHFYCILADSLPTYSIIYWDMGIQISNWNYGFVFFSL